VVPTTNAAKSNLADLKPQFVPPEKKLPEFLLLKTHRMPARPAKAIYGRKLSIWYIKLRG